MWSIPSLTPEQLANTPAAIPPPGVIPNLVNPHTEAKWLLIVLGALLLLMMFFFAGVRYYMKFLVHHMWTADDVTTFLAIIGTCCYYATVVHGVTVAKYGIHMWDLSIAHVMSDKFIISSLFFNIVSGPVWALAKTSFFLMYLQLFKPLNWVKRACRIGLVLCWGFYASTFIASLCFQAPGIDETWQKSQLDSRHENLWNLIVPVAVGNMTLDLYILIIPLIVASNMHLRKGEKLRLLAIFGTGILAVISSTISLVLKANLKSHRTDITYWVYPTQLLCLSEMTFGIACACIPSTAGFFQNSKTRTPSPSDNSPLFNLNTIRSEKIKRKKSHPPEDSQIAYETQSAKELNQIRSTTYITIGSEKVGTQELRQMEAGLIR